MKQNHKPQGRWLLAVDEAAQVRGLSPKSLRNRLAPSSAHRLDPRLKPIRVGKAIRIRLDYMLKITAEESDGSNHPTLAEPTPSR